QGVPECPRHRKELRIVEGKRLFRQSFGFRKSRKTRHGHRESPVFQAPERRSGGVGDESRLSRGPQHVLSLRRDGSVELAGRRRDGSRDAPLMDLRRVFFEISRLLFELREVDGHPFVRRKGPGFRQGVRPSGDDDCQVEKDRDRPRNDTGDFFRGFAGFGKKPALERSLRSRRRRKGKIRAPRPNRGRRQSLKERRPRGKAPSGHRLEDENGFGGRLRKPRIIGKLAGRQRRSSVPRTSFKDGRVVFPAGTIREYASAEKPGPLLPNRDYLFAKRFSSKEERRGLRCGVYLARPFPGRDKIGTSDKMNFVDTVDGSEMSEEPVRGSRVLFDSSLYNAYRRIPNGSTKGNATETNAVPVP
ncbi:MAG: hypothetical protein LBF41_02750, partial [Deltaproteobacteria bacterium]|nr:hypothetical protein [Deltaproteobacteria bacterium]